MLYRKHLHPWLLVLLITTIILLLSIIALLIFIIVSDISGWFHFVQKSFMMCTLSTYVKLSGNMEVLLKICFVLIIVVIVVAVGQVGIVLWQFVKFRMMMKKNDNDETMRFEDLTMKKLIVLYGLSFCGILSLVSVFGTFFSFYIELRNCNHDTSSLYLIPWIIAGDALLFQLVSFLFLMKLFYHFRQQLLDQQQQKQTDQKRWEREQKQLKDLKRRISQTKIDMEMAQKQKNRHQNSSLTEYESQRDIQSGLLNKYSGGRANNGQRDNTIYGRSNGQGQNSNNPPNYSKMSPDSISAKQKQLMKTLPRHPFKKNGQQNFGPNDVIFQESLQSGQQDDLQDEFNTPRKHRQSQQTQRPSTVSPPLSSQPRISMSQLFRQRYLNSPYLKHLENKAISPEQRRAIKRPFLKLASSLVEFDAKNYEIDDIGFSEMEEFIVGRKRTKKVVPQKKNEKMEVQEKNSLIRQRRKGSMNQPVIQPIVDPNTSTAKQSPTKNLKNYRSSNSILQRSILQGRKLQSQNPIFNYIQQDQSYQQKLSKILQFQKLSKRRRRTFSSNPFYPHYMDQKQSQGKLYLHKNKIDGYNNVGKNQNDDDQENQGYDPFRDAAYDDEGSGRGLLEDDLRRSAVKGELKRASTKELEVPVTQKKISRKDVILLDFIRSKHVVD